MEIAGYQVDMSKGTEGDTILVILGEDVGRYVVIDVSETFLKYRGDPILLGLE